jgi:hypothetical protein
MADAVTSQTLTDNPKTAIFKFTNISDGSGESAVKKIDVSALSASIDGSTCTRATIDDFCIELGENQSGHHDYTSFGGLPNPASSGVTGDIMFTTVGHTSADTYTIIMQVQKSY